MEIPTNYFMINTEEQEPVSSDWERIRAVVASVREEAAKVLAGEGKHGCRPLLWDGKAAERIVAELDRLNDEGRIWLVVDIIHKTSLASLDLAAALQALLDHRLRARLNVLAPTHLLAPSGSRLPRRVCLTAAPEKAEAQKAE